MESLKTKILRDFNKINKPQKANILASQQHIIGIDNINFSRQYLNLLELIKNTWFQQVQIPTKKLCKSDLDNIDIKFLEEVSQLDNVEVVNSPLFTYIRVENGSILSSQHIVTDIPTDTLKFIKEHWNYTFHIYLINPNYARWYMRKATDQEYRERLKKSREKKLDNLKKIEIEI